MVKVTRCLVCDSGSARLLYRSSYDGGLEEAHEYFLAGRKAAAHGEISRCRDCGFVFTSRQFEESEYSLIYSRVHASPAAPQDPGAEAVAARLRFARLQRVIGQYADLRAPFLDFGCGNGAFLELVGSPAGTGFEVGAAGARTGPHGTRILSGSWTEVAGSPALPWGSQHAVAAFDVFEHLPELGRDVDLIRRVLQPGGHLFVTVPDVRSLLARLTGRRWNMLLLEHLWYFSARTLDRFMLDHGFVALKNLPVPYDATVGHIVKRLGESLKVRLPAPPRRIREVVIPAPAGVLLAVYRKP